MCMSLTHRLQLLLEEEQYERLARHAQAEGRSVGSLVRQAIDMAWVEPDARRRAALDIILSAETMPVPDVDELRDELDQVRAGSLS